MADNLWHHRTKIFLTLLCLVFVLVALTLGSIFPNASNQGYAPEQPIPFSHKIHAGINKISCTYCHTGAEKSRHATIPALSVCMNCHTVVKLESPHVQNLRKHYEQNLPIEWIRVHELPDYVYFPHKRHIAAGLACETCHGDVKRMDRIEQYSPLTMGWCLDCHRGVTTPKHVVARLNPRGKQVAPINCTTCHN